MSSLSLPLSLYIRSPPPRRSARLHGCQPQRAETRPPRHRLFLPSPRASLPTPAARHRIAAAAANVPRRASSPLSLARAARRGARLSRSLARARVLSGGNADRRGRRSPSGGSVARPPAAPPVGDFPQFRARWAHLAGQ